MWFFFNWPAIVILTTIIIVEIFIWDTEDFYPCSLRDPIYLGRIQDPELVEASGSVASHKNPGVYYSIQGSPNPSNVYVIRYDGLSLGKIFL